MAAQKGLNPFDSQDIALAQSVIQSSDMALELYAKCTDCNANVSAMIEQVKAQREFALAILRNFGTPTPA